MGFLPAASILFAFQLASFAQCHIRLQQPFPYSPSTLQLDPLKNVMPGSADSDFPCQLLRQGGADPFEVDKENEVAVGETQTMTFDGSASHGGGTCQLSVTLDRKPTANSKFKTIVSWIGGCPMDAPSGGTIPFNYTIPPEVPNGKATLAWSWVSKLSGQPEFYMNCAPITVSGGADDTTKFDELEDMFRVNLPSSECGSQLSSNLNIPNPGKYVTTIDTQALLDPTGSGCAALGQATQSNAGGAATSTQQTSFSTTSSMTSSTTHSSSPSSTFTTTVPTSSNNTSSYASATYSTVVPSQSSSSSTSPYSNSTQCSPNGALICNGHDEFGLCNWGNVVFQPVVPGTMCDQGKIVGVAPYSNATQCSPDGALVCNGSDQFGLCNSGKVVFQPVAAGTTCEQGHILKKRHLESHRRRARGHSRRRWTS